MLPRGAAPRAPVLPSSPVRSVFLCTSRRDSATGEYSSATVSGHSVWFWVGVPAHCGGGGISLAAVGILAAIGLILLALVISGLRRRHARACDHPVHTHRT